jgi:pimeloyl-ACP methyl ester carboxylesterase
MTFWVLAALLTSRFAPAAEAAVPSTTTVQSLQGRVCAAYLHLPSAEPGAVRAIVLEQHGSGPYSMASPKALDPAGRYFIERDSVAVVAIDKPGVRGDPADPERIDVDTAAYDAYLVGDLVDCAANALAWAAALPLAKQEPPIFLKGHSEGAYVAVRVYAKLNVEGSPLVPRIRALLLSGVPVEGQKTVIDRQLSAESWSSRRKIRRAIKEGDNDVLHRWAGVSSAYVRDAEAVEPLSRIFDSLARIRPKARFELFQGLEDAHTPPAPVQALEADNERRVEKNEPALDLRVRYYAAGHPLNRTAVEDMRAVLDAQLRR